MNSATIICFSPTGSTRKVLESIAQGTGIGRLERIDLTPPAAAERRPPELRETLAIIGCPVYGGRVPVDAVSRLRGIEGNGAPAAVVVVYGNRAYEDALVELRDLARERGFRPVAAAAFIGEHSFSTADAPIAAGRPDAEDLRRAAEFGRMLAGKTGKLRSLQDEPPVTVPGNIPYKERGGLSNIAPVTEEAVCTRCGECVPVCPTAAIPAEDPLTTDTKACIRCCACIKVCPVGARRMDDPGIRQIAERLSVNCSARKEPEIYL